MPRPINNESQKSPINDEWNKQCPKKPRRWTNGKRRPLINCVIRCSRNQVDTAQNEHQSTIFIGMRTVQAEEGQTRLLHGRKPSGTAQTDVVGSAVLRKMCLNTAWLCMYQADCDAQKHCLGGGASQSGPKTTAGDADTSCLPRTLPNTLLLWNTPNSRYQRTKHSYHQWPYAILQRSCSIIALLILCINWAGVF